MDLVARKKLNLEVLKRHDSNICDILDQSAHAVVYKFDTDKASWEKLGYEGVIFLTQGKSAPYFGLYVLNRLSIENFSLHLTDFEEISLTDEFIIYQTSEGEACALWLFEKKDRERILAKIQKLHEGMKALPSAVKQQQPRQQQQNHQPVEAKGMDLLQMLKTGTVTQVQPTQLPATELLHMLKQASSPPPSKPSPLETVGNDLLSVLGGGQQQQQQQQQQPFPPAAPPNNNEKVYLNISTASAEDNNRSKLQGPVPPHQRRIIANGELTKPFYPNSPSAGAAPAAPFLNMNNGSPANSPRNPGALLQTLHGGLLPPQPQQLPLPPHFHPPPPHPHMNMSMLPPQQAMGLLRPEIARRFGNRQLSKPEFIQQLLNMIQRDPTFFDILYDNYSQQQQQMGMNGPNSMPTMSIPHPHPAQQAPPSSQQQQQQQMQ